jgi:AbrB family looped-hinge helix DNA binding protein
MKEVDMEKRSVATLRDRGQLTIPADVRKQAQLEEGAVVEFEVREEGLLLRPKIVLDDVQLDEGFIQGVIDSTATAYASLRADKEAWTEELAERAVLEGSLADGVED